MSLITWTINLLLLGSVQVLHQRVKGWSDPKCWHCWCFGGRWGITSQNDDMLTLWREGVWRVETQSKYCCKILKIINKLMNFFLNHIIISLNIAPSLQNIFLMIIENHILIIWNLLYKSSSNSTSVQILHQQIRGGGRKPNGVIIECSLREGLKNPFQATSKHP